MYLPHSSDADDIKPNWGTSFAKAHNNEEPSLEPRSFNSIIMSIQVLRFIAPRFKNSNLVEDENFNLRISGLGRLGIKRGGGKGRFAVDWLGGCDNYSEDIVRKDVKCGCNGGERLLELSFMLLHFALCLRSLCLTPTCSI